jgi:glycosyltransferase involved in cell wall biosynthesis
MTARQPKVSVLIPTYNYAQYLPEAIDSVMAQDWHDFELLIGDDCSTDATAKVLASYAAKHSRLRIHVHPATLGMVENWNWCLAQARGEFIKFIFADDGLAQPQALRKLVESLEANPSATLAASARYVLDENSKATAVLNEAGRRGLHSGHEVIVRCLDLDANVVGEPSAVMFRRRDAPRGFDTRYRQLVDLKMWFALLEKGDLIYTPEPLCWFRKHSRQQTEVNRRERKIDHEHLRLFWEYHRRPYLPRTTLRRLLFRRVYYSRKRSERSEESLQIERDLIQELGPVWYAGHWLRHKVTRPFANLHRCFERPHR